MAAAPHPAPASGFSLAELSPRALWSQVGEGSFGTVWRATLLGRAVAVKENGNSKESRLASLRRDVEYLSKFAHPNIVQIFGWWQTERRFYVVMEFMQHCLRERRTVNRVDLVESLADVARALARLHAEGHIHRDVKARNVLVSADYATAKLADFGLARPLVREGGGGSGGASGGGGMTPRVGPRKYRAPEVEAGAQYGTAVDVFSYGVMVVAQLKARRARRYGCSLELLRVLSRVCARPSPSARPTAMCVLAVLQNHLGLPLRAEAWGAQPLGRLSVRMLAAAAASAAAAAAAAGDDADRGAAAGGGGGGRGGGGGGGGEGAGRGGRKRGRDAPGRGGRAASPAQRHPPPSALGAGHRGGDAAAAAAAAEEAEAEAEEERRVVALAAPRPPARPDEDGGTDEDEG